MREILFRGKRLDNGELVYGYLFRIWDETYILWGTTNGTPNMIEVDPATVGQYTGLTDKNGVKIFEGDLFWYGWNRKYEILMSVIFEDGEFRLQKAKYYEFVVWNIRLSGENESLEIVGNIHDNPELLEGVI